MAKQNIYDNEIFFEGYKKIRDNEINANNLFEIPCVVMLKGIWIRKSCIQKKEMLAHLLLGLLSYCCFCEFLSDSCFNFSIIGCFGGV